MYLLSIRPCNAHLLQATRLGLSGNLEALSLLPSLFARNRLVPVVWLTNRLSHVPTPVLSAGGWFLSRVNIHTDPALESQRTSPAAHAAHTTQPTRVTPKPGALQLHIAMTSAWNSTGREAAMPLHAEAAPWYPLRAHGGVAGSQLFTVGRC